MSQIAFYSYSKGVPDGSGQQLRMMGRCLWEKGSRQMQEWTAQVCIQYGTPANALRVCGYRGNWHVVIPLRTSVLRLLAQWSIGEKSPADVQQRLAQLPAFLHLSRFPSASSPPPPILLPSALNHSANAHARVNTPNSSYTALFLNPCHTLSASLACSVKYELHPERPARRGAVPGPVGALQAARPPVQVLTLLYSVASKSSRPRREALLGQYVSSCQCLPPLATN